MVNDIHALMRYTDDIYTITGNGIKNQMSSFGKAMIARLNIIPVFAKPRIF
jgi:hypothetical protein